MHHAVIAGSRPVNRRHLWFALLCLMVAGYVFAQAKGHQAQSPLEIVSWRRWDLGFAALIFVFLPWFAREYAGLRSIWGPVVLSVILLGFLILNLLLPFGFAFSDMPAMRYQTLPWGEQVVDLRARPGGAVYLAGVLAASASMAYALYAGVQQYRGGERLAARRLLLAVAVFALLVQVNSLVNLEIIDFFYTDAFGFLALVLLMNRALNAESRMAHQYMRALIDHVPALVYVKDAQGRYLLVNRRFEETFRVSGRSLAGRSDEALVKESNAEGLRANDRQVLDTGRAVEFEDAFEMGNEARTFSTLKFPILDPEGKPCAICGISTDISAERGLEREVGTLRTQVWHADRVARLNTLGSSLAHELRQPLAAILANAEAGLRLLARDPPDLDESKAILRDIVRDNGRAIAIIDGLRDMLRYGAAGRRPVRLADVVQEALDYTQGEMRRRGVACERSLDASCVVLVDKVQIGQVVLNLVMNALDAMEDRPPGQKELFVSVARDREGQAEVKVRDSGTGLPAGDPEGIFESFFSTKTRGLGMGLPLSRSIIESHGGRIWATNNADRGATVQFVLPLTQGADA
jgi:PAS domain S-box-containing protein